ncbi:MAG: hypothetical protein M0R80_04965 [Proteobacteria bacterium]|nr:hypothetical protein [Pseudomonadota bacterium]
MLKRISIILAVLSIGALAMVVTFCSDDGGGGTDSDTDTDTDTDTDSDTDTDTDSDTDSDTDTDSDSDTDTDSDSDADGGPDGGAADAGVWTCEYDCHSATWCTSHSGTVHDDMTCPGEQVCCETT